MLNIMLIINMDMGRENVVPLLCPQNQTPTYTINITLERGRKPNSPSHNQRKIANITMKG